MSILARFEQSTSCQPAVTEAVPLPIIPRQRTASTFPELTSSKFEIPTVMVPELGRLTMLHDRVVQLADDAQPRLRRTMSVDLSGQAHLARITEPQAEGAPADNTMDTVVLVPGFTEMIHACSAKNLHDALAPYYPHSRIISIATPGVGRYGQRMGWRAALGYDFQRTAIDTHRLINVLRGTGTLDLMDESMGSIIDTELLLFNAGLSNQSAADTVQDKYLEIATVVHHSSALVPPGRILPDMVGRFPTHMTVDNLRVQASLGRPLPGLVSLLRAYPRSALALMGNSKNILKGVDPKKVAAVEADHIVGYVSGSRDPLAQTSTRLRAAAQNPNHVAVNIKPQAGHAAAVDARSTAADMAAMHQVLRTMAQATASL